MSATPAPARLRCNSRRARASGDNRGVPVRPRRRPDADGEGARRGVEGDVRRVPARAGGADGGAVRPVRRGRRLRRVRRRQAARSTACARSSPRAGSSCRRGHAADPPEAETVAALGNRKNESSCAMARDRRRGLRGLGALRARGARRRPAAGRRLLERATAARCWQAAGIADLFEDGVDGDRRRARAPARQAGAGHVPRAAARCSASSRRRRPCSRTRSPASRPAARAASASSSASTASARPTRCARTAPTSSSTISPSCSTAVIARPALRGRAVGAPRDARSTSTMLAQTESVFALSNGHIGLRGNLDEGEPYGLPGTYLNSFYELRPLPYAEAGYGYPESGQTIVNVTNGKIIRLLVDDEPFDVRYGQLLAHERVLDLRAGMLAPHGRVALAGRDGGARPLDAARLVRPARDRRDPLRGRAARRAGARRRAVGARRQRARARRDRADPRAAAALESPLVSEESFRPRPRASCSSTRRGERPARWRPRWTTSIEGPRRDRRARRRAAPDVGRVTVAADLAPGERLRIVKFVAYGWSSQRSHAGAARPGRRRARRGAAHRLGRARRRRSARYLDDFWERADVELDGDAELQQAVRFALFHALQAGARAERRAIPAKGLTGPGLRRPHVLGHRALRPAGAHLHRAATPPATRCAGGTRRSTSRASARAQLGLAGAAFPWRTIHGQECSGYWPAGTAAFHVNADIADAVVRYQARDRRRGVRARGRPRAPRRDGAAVALARPPRRRRAASASTASPAPTSTARSPTTTSTRT